MNELGRRAFLGNTAKNTALGLFFLSVPNFAISTLSPEITPIAQYLQSIEGEKNILEEILINQGENVMLGIKNLSPEQNLEDFNIYYPIYRAAELKYGIPWFLTWIIHVHETTTSRHPNPLGSGHIGAMQLSPEHFHKKEIIQAPMGWEFLDELPQRYSKKLGWPTNDWEDVLQATHFIRWVADWGETAEEDENKVLDVIRYRYSALEHGLRRTDKYYQLKELFV